MQSKMSAFKNEVIIQGYFFSLLPLLRHRVEKLLKILQIPSRMTKYTYTPPIFSTSYLKTSFENIWNYHEKHSSFSRLFGDEDCL